MATKIICDRCGQEIEEKPNLVKLVAMINGEYRQSEGETHYYDYLPVYIAEFCPDCMTWLRENWPFMDTAPRDWTMAQTQLSRLADYILSEWPRKITWGGAVDVAMEILKGYKEWEDSLATKPKEE